MTVSLDIELKFKLSKKQRKQHIYTQKGKETATRTYQCTTEPGKHMNTLNLLCDSQIADHTNRK